MGRTGGGIGGGQGTSPGIGSYYRLGSGNRGEIQYHDVSISQTELNVLNNVYGIRAGRMDISQAQWESMNSHLPAASLPRVPKTIVSGTDLRTANNAIREVKKMTPTQLDNAWSGWVSNYEAQRGDPIGDYLRSLRRGRS